jgi:hypothetical protein
MPDQPIQGRTLDRCEQERQIDSGILNIMFNDPSSWPWSVQELAREMDDGIEATDAVRRLTDTGLVHRLGDFIFPSRTARRAAEIEIGT